MSTNAPERGFVLSNKTYDKIKFLVRIVLPALGVLYATLAGFWGFPKVEEIVGTITGLALFLGVMGRSSANFEPEPVKGTPVGTFVVKEDPDSGKKVVTLGELTQDPAEFINGDVISFHVAKEAPEVTLEETDRDENSH